MTVLGRVRIGVRTKWTKKTVSSQEEDCDAETYGNIVNDVRVYLNFC